MKDDELQIRAPRFDSGRRLHPSPQETNGSSLRRQAINRTETPDRGGIQGGSDPRAIAPRLPLSPQSSNSASDVGSTRATSGAHVAVRAGKERTARFRRITARQAAVMATLKACGGSFREAARRLGVRSSYVRAVNHVYRIKTGTLPA
jgi:hypothetical protein